METSSRVHPLHALVATGSRLKVREEYVGVAEVTISPMLSAQVTELLPDLQSLIEGTKIILLLKRANK